MSLLAQVVKFFLTLKLDNTTPTCIIYSKKNCTDLPKNQKIFPLQITMKISKQVKQVLVLCLRDFFLKSLSQIERKNIQEKLSKIHIYQNDVIKLKIYSTIKGYSTNCSKKLNHFYQNTWLIQHVCLLMFTVSVYMMVLRGSKECLSHCMKFIISKWKVICVTAPFKNQKFTVKNRCEGLVHICFSPCRQKRTTFLIQASMRYMWLIVLVPFIHRRCNHCCVLTFALLFFPMRCLVELGHFHSSFCPSLVATGSRGLIMSLKSHQKQKSLLVPPPISNWRQTAQPKYTESIS